MDFTGVSSRDVTKIHNEILVLVSFDTVYSNSLGTE